MAYNGIEKCVKAEKDFGILLITAKREQKPVYINNDLFGGTFRRNWEGDYHCTRLQVKTMLRDQAEETMDMKVLDEAEIEDLNKDSVRGYCNSHKSFKSGHPFERLDDSEYLRVIGAAGISKEDKRLHPTAAGMLMFGNEYDIVRYFPEYSLDRQIKVFVKILYMFLHFRYNEIITIVNINRERGDKMPGEKEININLFERLDLIDRLEEADKEGGYEKMKKQLAFERKLIERKLYQKPPLTSQ